MRARVLLVDDNQEFLHAVADLLGPHFEIVGLAKDGVEAIAEYRRLHPDLVVLDVSMPIMDGFDAARELAKFEKDVRIVLLSVDHSVELHEAARHTGVLGSVSKPRMYKDLIPAIRRALEGREFCSPNPA